MMTKDTQITPFLRTKLHRPFLGKDHLHRQHLLDRLNQGLYRPLTLVSAPAGYGKSTLISSWLGITDIPGAWLSLDRQDNDLRQFLFGFLAALQSISPGAGKDVLAMISEPSLPPLRMIVRDMINNMDRIERHFILVLDDFHIVTDKSVIEFLQELLRHPPRHLHLILVGRKDPFLPISTLRARDQLTEVRIKDLRFTEWEVKEFLNIALPDRVEANTAIELTERTEGWVAGIRLAVLASRGQEDSIAKLIKLKGTHAYVMDYLITEVLKVQPKIIRHHLLVTSILDRFTGALCEALSMQVSGQGDSNIDGADFIETLKRENLFLITLDTENCWFRYHHLFRELLLNQLNQEYSSEEIAALHMRANDWFAANGLIDEGIQHAIFADDVNGAIQLIEQNRLDMLNNNRGYIFEKWLAMIPDSAVQQRPQLLMAQIWVHYFQNKFASIPPIIDVVESLLSDGPDEQALYGEINLFKGVFCYMRGDGPHAMKYIEDALCRIPESNHMVRGFVEIYFGLAGQMQGQKERVVRVLSDIVYQHSLNLTRKFRVMIGLIWVHMISGDLDVASTLNKQLGKAGIDNNEASFYSWSLYNQGLIHFQRNELDEAIHYLSQAAEYGHLMLRRATVDCIAGLSLAYQAAQRPDKADTALDSLFEYIHSLNDPALLDIAHSCRTRLSLMTRKASTAPIASITNPTSNDGAMAIWFEIPCMTRCRALITEGSDVDLREAEQRLRGYAEMNETHNNTYQLVGIFSLLALACEKKEKFDEAQTSLEQALTLARPGGFIFPFLELGTPMEDLLNRLHSQNMTDNYIEKLLAEFRAHELRSMPNGSTPDLIRSPSKVPQPLVEPLTNRELDVLELLAQRLQNKEIAEKLFVSNQTVKSHLKNIYQKLNVSSRRKAVDQADRLGIIKHR